MMLGSLKWLLDEIGQMLSVSRFHTRRVTLRSGVCARARPRGHDWVSMIVGSVKWFLDVNGPMVIVLRFHTRGVPLRSGVCPCA